MKPKTEENKKKDVTNDKQERDNRSRQLNPQDDEYWKSRGLEKRPDDWQERLDW